jgi:hypothetical protein
MDWIEQVFHVDPDRGSGMVELALLLLLARAVVIVVCARRIRPTRNISARERQQS